MKLKGHTTIELRNVETGEVKKYEDDNMFTNAIAKMVNFAIKHSLGANPLDVLTTHWYNLLGGLVLFDTALTESADNIYAPAGVTPVGYGQVGNTNSYQSMNEWGTYNSQESDTSATDQKVFVWDFSTSHANGTIASVCLTHRNAGMAGFGMKNMVIVDTNTRGDISVGTGIIASSKGRQGRSNSDYGLVGSNLSLNDGSYMDFCIDSVNDLRYQFKVCLDGLSVIKVSLSPEKFDIFRGSTYYQSYDEDTYSETFTGSYFYHCYNPDEKVLYFWTTSTDTVSFGSGGVDVYIHKFDMSGSTPTLTKNWKRLQVSNYETYNSFVIKSSAIYVIGRATSGGYFCIKKFDTSSGTVTTVKTLVQAEIPYGYSFYGSYNRKPFIINGLMFVPAVINSVSGSSVYHAVVVDTSDDSFRFTNVVMNGYSYSYPYMPGTHIPPIDKTQIVFGSILNSGEQNDTMLTLNSSGGDSTTNGNLFAPIQYLGTINNLSEAIVKTAQQTMKVTYTITAEEEE